MRILHVIRSAAPESGGPIEGIIKQSQALKFGGVWEIVTLDNPDETFLRNFPLPVHAMGNVSAEKRGGGLLDRFGYSPLLVPWLKANIHMYDRVVVNGIWDYAAVACARVLPHHDTPYVVFTHGMLDPWFRTRYPLKHLRKQIFWSAFQGKLFMAAQQVLFTTIAEQDAAKGMFLGFQNYRRVVVPYGTADAPPKTSAQLEAFRSMVPALATRPYLLFLSRIHPKKGCDILIRSFARVSADFPDLQLVIAGPDKEGLGRALRELATDLGVSDRIHWPGMLAGDAKWGAYFGSEAFVLASHQENFGIVVAEALACGKPVIITTGINIWREIEDAGAGVVATAAQDDAFVKALGAFLSMTGDQKSAMGVRARDCFLEHFWIEKTVASIFDEIVRIKAA